MMLLLFLVLAYAKQNFQIEPIDGATLGTAITNCFAQGKCVANVGCCNGQGKCQSDNETATCVCESCPGSSTTYYTVGSNCASLEDDTAFEACCGDTYSYEHNFDPNGYCNQRDPGVYKPYLGAKGNLGRHVGGSPNYGDGYSTNQTSHSDILNMIANLTSSARPWNTTSFTMFAVGSLQVALKDVYDPKLSTNEFWVNGHRYYHLEVQENTGIPGSPKAVENMATTAIDLGPVYDHTIRQTRSGLTLPYLEKGSAGVYWSDTHHVTEEFLVIIELYEHYHNYIIHNLEDVFCNENSISANIDYSGCRVYTESGSTSDQDFSDFLFETARRSNIRFSQVMIEQNTLQILIDNPINMTGREEVAFEFYINRDQWSWRYPQDFVNQYKKVRQHQEFSNKVTKNEFAQYILTGIDVFLSLRNPDMDLDAPTLIGDGSQCGLSVIPFASKVINLMRTPARRFGGQIDPKYSEELEVIFHRINELGLADYKTHAEALTDSVYVGDLDSGVNVLFGIMNEQNPGRQWRTVAPSVAFAAAMGINDAIFDDPTNYYQRENVTGWPIGQLYHPQHFDLETMDFCYDDCYSHPTAYNAWNQVSEINEWTGWGWGYETRSHGCMWSHCYEPQYWRYDIDTANFYPSRWRAASLINEVANLFFYQFDGPNTFALWHSDMDDNFGITLPNSVVDAFPYNMGWRGIQETDCYRYETTVLDCRRDNVVQTGNYICTSYPDSPHMIKPSS